MPHPNDQYPIPGKGKDKKSKEEPVKELFCHDPACGASVFVAENGIEPQPCPECRGPCSSELPKEPKGPEDRYATLMEDYNRTTPKGDNPSLEDLAAELGIEDPSDRKMYPRKDALVNAIITKESGESATDSPEGEPESEFEKDEPPEE